MTIDDVHHLLKNNVPDSALIFVDSTTRDRLKHPQPSEYVVQLDDAVRFVHGLDVLDATIPKTMYNVDVHNNVISLLYVDTSRSWAPVGAGGLAASLAEEVKAAEGGQGETVAEVEALRAELLPLGRSAVFNAWRGGAAASVTFMVVDAADATPAALAAKTVTTASTTPPPADADWHALLVRHTHVGVTFERVSDASESTDLPATQLDVNDATPYVLSAEGLSGAAHADIRAHIVAGRTFHVVRTLAVGGRVRGTVTFYEAVYVSRDDYGNLEPLEPFDITRSTELRPRLTCKTVRATLDVGNYTIKSLQTELQRRFAVFAVNGRGAAISLGATSDFTTDVLLQGRFKYTCGTEAGAVRFIINARDTLGLPLMGVDTLPLPAESTRPLATRQYQSVQLAGDELPCFMSVRRRDGGDLKSVLLSPDLVNVTGIQYLTLRCPEIEQHIMNANKYGRYSTGIGVFKLTANSGELNALRFDFTTLVRKAFHPIGRLSRLTFRFERPDGALYDFKGINHHMLIAIKYYSPAPITAALDGGAGGARVRSVLNPDYDPDYLKYAMRQDDDRADAMYDKGYDDDSDWDGDDEPDDAGVKAPRTLTDAQRRLLQLEQYVHGGDELDVVDGL